MELPDKVHVNKEFGKDALQICDQSFTLYTRV